MGKSACGNVTVADNCGRQKCYCRVQACQVRLVVLALWVLPLQIQNDSMSTVCDKYVR